MNFYFEFIIFIKNAKIHAIVYVGYNYYSADGYLLGSISINQTRFVCFFH